MKLNIGTEEVKVKEDATTTYFGLSGKLDEELGQDILTLKKLLKENGLTQQRFLRAVIKDVLTTGLQI